MVLRKHLPTLTAALVLGLGGAAGCAAPEPPAKSTTAKGPSIDPNADPLPPQIVPADGRLALDTEYYLGSEAEERASFAEFARQIQELQDRAAADRSQPIQRGFHAKSHGCLDGTLELDPHRDPRTRYGVFADDSITRHVIVRFSNGVGWKQGDSELDARGMAIKVLDVPGPKYQPDEKTTQDFLMTNTPVPVGRDAEQFMRFARANVKGKTAGFLFLFGNAPDVSEALSRTNAVNSMVTERYWSGGAYHLGAHQAVKFMTRPCDLTLVRDPKRSD
ncbi:MAG TPA: catalase, partial [Polyangiaceae bacterium]